MRRSLVRPLLGMLLALALVPAGSSLAAGRAQPARAATTWQAQVGGASADHALQAQAFLPTTLTINEGDTVNWTFAPVHTVTFLSGSPPPELFMASSEGLELNPAVAFPAGGPDYDGTGYVNSGILPETGGTSFALTFTKAGSYGYICLLHPGMAGTVIVQPAGSTYPMTQAQVDAQANSELYARLASANQQLQSARLTTQANSDGTTTYTVINGIGGNQASVLRFLPVEVTIRAGDRVSFPVQDPHEVHTVTFYDPAGPVPAFLEPQPQPAGPPKLLIRNATPEGGTVVDRQGLFNSGILAPGQSYTFTFPKPGVYTYVCMLHAAEGMFGTITVQAAGQPATLPVTGAGTTAPSLLLLVAGALVLLALGAWIARRRLSRPAGGL